MGHNGFYCLLVVCFISSGPASALKMLNGSLGGSMLFPTDISWQKPREWRFGVFGNDTVIGVLNSTPDCYPEYHNRCVLLANGSLLLHNLTSADEGQYVLIREKTRYYHKNDYFWLQIVSHIPAIRVLNMVVGGSLYLPQYAGWAAALEWRNINSDFRVAGKKPNEAPNCNAEIQSRCEMSNDGSLRVNNLTYSDDGSYVLIVGEVPPNISQIFPYHLNIYNALRPPVVRLISGRLVSGTNVTFSCDLQDYGTNFTFSRDGKNICSEPHVICNYGMISFQPITESDSGNYTCTAHNPVSSSTSKIRQVAVSAPPTTHLTISNSGPLYVGEDSVSLYCTTQISNANFLWKKYEIRLMEDSRYHVTREPWGRNSTLTISPVTERDKWSFRCEAFNDTVRGNSDTVRLNLAWRITSSISCETKMYSESTLLICSWPGGRPRSYIAQIFNGTVKMGQEVVRTFVRLDKKPQEMVCQGEQMRQESECKLTFDRPQSTSHNDTVVITVMEGEDAEMMVNLSHYFPYPQFSWFFLKADDPIPIYSIPRRLNVISNGFQSTLLIPGVTASENGTYQCRAGNLIGNTSFLFLLQVTPTESSGSANPSPEKLRFGSVTSIVTITVGVVAALALFGLGVLLSNRKPAKKSVLYSEVPPPCS